MLAHQVNSFIIQSIQFKYIRILKGCGKSTTIALLLRFYDVDRGAIYLDDYDIRSLNIGWLRSKIGLVSQEPSLFNTTIYENICYGDIDRSEIPMHEILMAAAQANIQNKIENLPLKYDTIVGNKGSQLSGGEKQRIAIGNKIIWFYLTILIEFFSN